MAAERTVGQLTAGRKVFSILETESLFAALEFQKQHSVSRLPVLSAEGKLVGLLSISDLRLAAESPLFHTGQEIETHLRDTKVSQAMHKTVETLSPEDPLVNAAKLLRVSSYGGMPVVDKDNNVVGMLTRSDILDEYIRVVEPL